MSTRIRRFMVDCENMDIDYQDAGPWRSYEMTATGDTFEEMCEDATITEVDQDGGEIASYSISDASTKVVKRGEAMIMNCIEKWQRNQIEAARDYKTNQKIAEAKEGY